MNGIEQIIEDIVKELAMSPYMANRQVVCGYSYAFADDPLRRDTVAVSLNALELKEGAFGRYFGTAASGGEVCGREAVLEILLSAAVPKQKGGAGAHKLVADLASAILAGSFGGSVLAVNAGKLGYDKSFGGLAVPVTLILSCIIGAGVPESGERYTDIVVKLK